MAEVCDYFGNILYIGDIVKARYTNFVYEITKIIHGGKASGIPNKIMLRNMITGLETLGFPDAFEKIDHKFTLSEWEEHRKMRATEKNMYFGIIGQKEHRIDDHIGDALRYCANDVLSTQSLFWHFIPDIKDVIINPPATIIIWSDDTKTVVKCGEGETFDPEKGLAMAISKKVLGNKYMWHGKFNKWLKKYNKKEDNQNG